MGRKQKFIENLSVEEHTTLKDAVKNSTRADFRKRCEVILLSYKGYTSDQIVDILELNKTSVYKALGKWRSYGISGMLRQKGQGRKPTLDINNAEHIKLVEQKVELNRQKIEDLIPQIIEELQVQPFSKWTLRRFLKNLTTPGKDSEEG